MLYDSEVLPNTHLLSVHTQAVSWYGSGDGPVNAGAAHEETTCGADAVVLQTAALIQTYLVESAN